MDTSNTYYAMCAKAFPEDAERGIAFKTQDQLQEMVFGTEVTTKVHGLRIPHKSDWFDWLIRLVNFAYDFTMAKGGEELVFTQSQQGSQFTSMEQLWLALVMKEKFRKIWSNGDWVNAES